MARIKETPMLLSLPLELREQVYRSALSHAPHPTYLLRTCREIYAEAHKLLFQRPLFFRSQSDLYQWLERVPPKFLQYVSEITVELEDVDLRPLLRSFDSPRLPATPMPRLLAWQLYETELECLNQALGKIGQVEILTLQASSGRQSFLYREYLGKVLEMLGAIYPHLKHLSLAGNFHHQSLSFLKSFAELQFFSFDGFSASSPSHMASILSGLPHLTNLALVSQHTMLTPTNRQRSTFTSKRQSFTNEVMRTMKSLASFSVTETVQPSSFSALFFTSDILTSLHTHKSLNHLSILLSHIPDAEALEALEDFLEKSLIEKLELDWPNLNPQVLDTYALLPNCLKDFWVRATSMAAAFDILWPILEGREAGDVPELKRVVLVRGVRGGGDLFGGTAVRPEENLSLEGTSAHDDHHPAADDSDEDNFARAKRRLNALGVIVSWYTETS